MCVYMVGVEKRYLNPDMPLQRINRLISKTLKNGSISAIINDMTLNRGSS